MKRKVSKIGSSTLMVSLPSKWVKANNINKGDEVEIIEDGKILTINGRNRRKEKISINVKGTTLILYRLIGALYKAGYDEIELIYETPKELDIIQKQLGRTCIGFEMVEQTKNKVIIKRISNLEAKEFNVVLRRCFLSVLGMAEDSFDAIKEDDIDLMKKVILSDDNVNRSSDFCRRIINKEYDVGGRKAPIYLIAEQLEKVGDMYRDLTRYTIENRFKPSNQIFKIFKDINSFVRDFYNIYYNFEFEKMTQFVSTKNKIEIELEKSINSAKKEELKLLFYLRNIFSTTFDMNGALITAKI